MSYQAITSGEIASSEPVSNSTLNKIKSDFDDHETRIESLESKSSTDPCIILSVRGIYPVATNILKWTSNISFNISGARIVVDQAGTSGTLQVDIQRSRSGGAYASIFSTLPSVAYSAGNDATSSNAVLNSGMVDVQPGDILRLDITSGQILGKDFVVRLDYSRT